MLFTWAIAFLGHLPRQLLETHLSLYHCTHLFYGQRPPFNNTSLYPTEHPLSGNGILKGLSKYQRHKYFPNGPGY